MEKKYKFIIQINNEKRNNNCFKPRGYSINPSRENYQFKYSDCTSKKNFDNKQINKGINRISEKDKNKSIIKIINGNNNKSKYTEINKNRGTKIGESKFNSMIENINSLNNKIEKNRYLFEDYKAKNEIKTENHTNVIKKIIEYIERIDSHKEESKNQNEEIKKQIYELKKQNEELKIIFKNHSEESKNEEIKKQIYKLKKQNEELKKESEESKKTIEEIKKQIYELKTQNEELKIIFKNQSEESKNQNEEIKKQIYELKNQNEELKKLFKEEQNEELNKQNQKLVKYIEEIKKYIIKQDEEINNQNEKIIKYKEEIKKQNQKLKKENEEEKQAEEQKEKKTKKFFGKKYAIVGLSNPGNNCYMNSALQILKNIPQFTYNIIKIKDNLDGFLIELKNLFVNLCSPDISTFSPKDFKKYLGLEKLGKKFSGNEQNDSSIF